MPLDSSLFRLVFVCSGNTCRSPMAAGWAEKKYGAAFEIWSAGTDVGEGGVRKKAIDAMRAFGIDISQHRATEVDNLRLDRFDLIVALHDDIARDMIIAGLIKARDECEVWDVEDPYDLGPEAYARAATRLGELVDELQPRLIALADLANARRRSHLVDYIDARLQRIESGDIKGSHLLGVVASVVRRLELVLRKERRLCIAVKGENRRVQDYTLGRLIKDFREDFWHGRGEKFDTALGLLHGINKTRVMYLHPDDDRDREVPLHEAVLTMNRVRSVVDDTSLFSRSDGRDVAGGVAISTPSIENRGPVGGAT